MDYDRKGAKKTVTLLWRVTVFQP